MAILNAIYYNANYAFHITKARFMQGIPFFNYKILIEHLDKMLSMPDSMVSEEERTVINAYRKNVTDTYQRYSSVIGEISLLTKEFEKNKIDVRRLMSLRQKKIKQLQKKSSVVGNKLQQIAKTSAT